MKWLWGLITIVLFTYSTQAQSKYWELEQGELESMIKQANVIVTGQLKQIAPKNILRPSEVLLGPQRISSLSLILGKNERTNIKPGLTYIFFLRRQGTDFAPLSNKSIIKKDIFLLSRVRIEVMKWRVQRSDVVVVGTVQNIVEKQIAKDKIVVTAICQQTKAFKGQIGQVYKIRYQRIPKAVPPAVFLFDSMTYIFFLKKPSNSQNYYTLITPYEGAYPHRLYILKELKIVTRLENCFDQMAGKTVKGIRLIARTKSKVKQYTDTIINIVVQNAAKEKIEIYHNRVPYFLLLHVLDSDGRVIPCKYPRKNSVPAVHNRYFMNLLSGSYFLAPPINLRHFCHLKPGKYSIYIEYHLPWEYAGKTLGKTAWSGKVMSNRLELTVVE